ncbi:hypothetical protein [Morganella psychrotolerans]|uniref:hypothetical protein n=1 Tax=Morganella psychrotolerans TaxID=368603 RepID=UPI0039B0C7F1
MKSSLHYRLVIFSALIISGVFTGSCRAEIDISCPPLFMHVSRDIEDSICISKMRVFVCPKMCHPVNGHEEGISTVCFKKGEPFGEQTEFKIRVFIPENCELTLPIAVKPATEQ